MDRYENKLEEAIEKATYLPSILQWRLCGMTYLGEYKRNERNYYYYYDREANKYYVENDIDREMRAAIKRKRTNTIKKR